MTAAQREHRVTQLVDAVRELLAQVDEIGPPFGSAVRNMTGVVRHRLLELDTFDRVVTDVEAQS